jgi:hypothetical protein
MFQRYKLPLAFDQTKEEACIAVISSSLEDLIYMIHPPLFSISENSQNQCNHRLFLDYSHNLLLGVCSVGMVVLTREGLDMFPLDRFVLAIDLIFHSV